MLQCSIFSNSLGNTNFSCIKLSDSNFGRRLSSGPWVGPKLYSCCICIFSFLVCVVRISSFKEYVVKLHKVGSNLSMSHLRRGRSVTCMSSRHGYLPSCVTVTYGTDADDARSAGHGYEVPVGQQDCKICAGQTFCIPVSNVLTIPMQTIHSRPDTGTSVLVGQEDCKIFAERTFCIPA